MPTEKVKEKFFTIKVTIRLKHKVSQQSGFSSTSGKPFKLMSPASFLRNKQRNKNSYSTYDSRFNPIQDGGR